jgi:lipopolysaccharide export system protein LptA
VATAVALAQTASTFTLTRDDTELVVSNLALAADGARTIGNNRNCEEGLLLTIVYGPAPGLVATSVQDAQLTSSLAIIRAPLEAEEGSNEETLELLDASVTFSRPGCIEEMEPSTQPKVKLLQGRTEVTGSRFFLDRKVDDGVMDGPIALTRAAEGEGEPLLAEADSMTFAVGQQRATLVGNVRVTSEERVTTGASLELDEEAGTAVLLGSPARSTKGDDVLEGSRLLYYLDSDDVVIIGNVAGDLQIDLD